MTATAYSEFTGARLSHADGVDRRASSGQRHYIDGATASDWMRSCLVRTTELVLM
jgi:hypothetical protein